MKKFASISLIILLLFNWFGYGILVNYLQQKSDTSLEAMLDKNLYNDAELIELTIPLHLPYQTDRAAYERFDGEIVLNGIQYKYVKRKLYNDTLHLLCLPNTKRMSLETAKSNFYKNTNDLSQKNNSGKQKSITAKKIMSDFDEHFYKNMPASLAVLLQQPHFIKASNNLLSSPHISPEQPPDGTLA